MIPHPNRVAVLALFGLLSVISPVAGISADHGSLAGNNLVDSFSDSKKLLLSDVYADREHRRTL